MPLVSEAVFFAGSQAGNHPFEMRRKNSYSLLSGLAAKRSITGMYTDEENPPLESRRSKIFSLMDTYTPADTLTIQKKIVNHVEYTLARTRFNFGQADCYRATAYSIRDRLIETLNDTNAFFIETDVKRCYYLSLEYLVGRAMQNALVNLDLEANYRQALMELGYKLEELYEHEHDAALGNGGLGRLAACLLDSMATLNYPAWGYGIRYTYGIFEQKIVNGKQVEHPDYWLVQDNPWEIQRNDITYGIRFFGTVTQSIDKDTHRTKYTWTGGQIIEAMAFDNPIPGFDTLNCINLRLWKSAPSREFDFNSFNAGKYMDSVAERQDAECITAVLYPNDESEQGKILRLKQQYFFVCATIQDILRRFKAKANRKWDELPSKVVVQLNDTHPTIAIPELMRILIDIEELEWMEAWKITCQTFNYTNHTVMPEALEKWPVDIFGRLLPRHLLIINDINMHFLTQVRDIFGDDYNKVSKMSIYAEGPVKMIRMANLAVIGSNKVNGVASLHTQLVKRDLFPEFVEFYQKYNQKYKLPQEEKFVNIVNGVTPRRWIHCANRALSDLFSEWLGSDSWLKDLQCLQALDAYVDDEKFQEQWANVKLKNKKRLAAYIQEELKVQVDPNTMLFDIQVKRIHEYKRQLLNALHMIHRYIYIKKLPVSERQKVVPRLSLVGGKAAPGYYTAKVIIQLINCIANLVNNDPDVKDLYKVIFMPNYNVSLAMIIIPAADINQQLSTAGMEASGTSNMKFVMNGSLICGTLDGATVEICQEAGIEKMFIFGAKEEKVNSIRNAAAQGNYPIDQRLANVFDFIREGHLTKNDQQAYRDFTELVDRITSNGDGYCGDYFLVCHDFPSFVEENEKIDQLYKNQAAWTKNCILSAISMANFSTDRTVSEYANKIWNIKAAERPLKCPQEADHSQKETNSAVPSCTGGQKKNVDTKDKIVKKKK